MVGTRSGAGGWARGRPGARPPARPAGLVIGVLVGGLLLPVGVAEAAPAGRSVDRGAAYTAAAREFGVPRRLLLAVSYLESQWDTNRGEVSTSGGYGPMHLTDPRALAGATAQGGGQPLGDLRGGDTPTPRSSADSTVPAEPEGGAATTGSGRRAEGVRTLAAASELIKVAEKTLRNDPTQNIRGGAAILARYQRELGQPRGAGSDPARWYGAVARYSGASEYAAARWFADEVYTILRTGARHTTDDGYALELSGGAVSPDRSQLEGLGLTGQARADGGVECPATSACTWIPAPYQLLGNGTDKGNYGNHDIGNRPTQQKVEYIVIHDTEGSFGSAVNTVKNPNGVSWHYTIRSSDGYIAQHVSTRNVAWQAGNWYVNAKSIGIEHEGYAARSTWFTEAMYRSSAALVKYLAGRYGVPLDRAHIIGHDNVPGISGDGIRRMHWDPGPYWHWERYMDRMGAALPSQSTGSGIVMIKPRYSRNTPAYVGCDGTWRACPVRGSSEVILRSAPSPTASLVRDEGLHPGGGASTMWISDHGARASAGQKYAFVERRSNWTAIWYLGQKAWFYDPDGARTSVRLRGQVVRLQAGRPWGEVYGRAFPEPTAYPSGVGYQQIVALPYWVLPGQSYVVAGIMPSEYYHAVTIDGSAPHDRTVIRGGLRYIQVQFGHRVMYVNAEVMNIVSV